MTRTRRGRAAVAMAIAIGASALLGVPGGGIAVAQDIIAEGRNEWRWSITPYLWGSDIDTDVRFPGGQEIGGTVKFDDILDKLDFGGMLHLEGQKGAWGLFVDATYLTMSDDTTQGPISVDGEIDTGLYEFAATYTPGGQTGAFTAFAGARIVDLSLDLKFSAADIAAADPPRQRQEFYRLHGRWPVHAPVRRSLAVQRASGHRSGRHGVELECARRVWLEIRRRSQ